MSFKIDVSGVEQLGGGVADPDKEVFLELLDDWCERVESTARRHCNDPSGEKIKFFRDDGNVRVEGRDVASIDCLMQAMVEHHNRMDTSLTGVYEVVLEDLEKRREGASTHKS